MNKEFCTKIGKIGGLATRQKALEKYYENPKYCKNCGKIIEVRDNEKPSNTRERVFCSAECRSEFQKQKMIGNNFREYSLPHCLNCGKELKTHQNKYCDNKCQIEHQYKDYIDKWKRGLVTGLRGKYQLSEYIKRYIKEKYNNKCYECGWDKINPITKISPLEIHHKDGNYENNTEDNLVLLCPNCHSLTENYKSLNRNGRKDRI